MDFEAYLNSKYQSPFQVTGEIIHPSSSEFLLQDGSSHSEPSFGNLSRMVAAARWQFSSNDIDPGILADIPYLAATMEKNNQFTDFPSYTDGSYMDSYMNLPPRPVTTNYPRVTDSSGVDHLLVPVQSWAQQSLRQQNQRSVLQANEFAVPSLMKFDCSGQVQKKPRLEPTKDDVIRYMIQQILLSESSKESRSHELTASPRQYQIQNVMQKETIHLPPKTTEASFMSRHIPAPEPQLSPNSCGGIYADQLMQYLHHRRQKPRQNNIAYWRKFVAEYFDSNANKRWCFSKYDNVGCHAHFAFSQCAVDSWNCDLCGTKSGRGFEAKYEVLPRLCKLKFDNGLADELLYLDFPCESKLPMGCVMLRYTKAVQETVYKNSRVIHEGQLCVIFTKDIKIISWEFCSHRHEEFVLRRSIAPQVKQLVQVSQKYQDNIDRSKSSGNLRQAMQATHNKFLKAGQQLERALDSHVTELGLSKQLARFLQVAEVIDCMKDLFSFSRDNNLSPIDSLNRYAATTKFKVNQMNHQQHTLQEDSQGFISTGYNTESSSKQVQLNTESFMSPWNSYQNLLTRNSITSDSYGVQGDQDHRKYVLNKLMMQKMFSNGAVDQEQQLLMAGGSQTKIGNQRGPRKGPKAGNSGSKFRRCIKKETEDMEEFGVPMLPGVKVKNENYYG